MIHGILIIFLLISASVQDICLRKISDFIPFAMIVITKFSDISAVDAVLGAIFAFIIIIPAFSKIGGGDLKLITALGGNIGINYIFAVIIVTLILSTIYGKTRKKKSIPFAPFLSASYILVLILYRRFSNVF